MVAFNQFIRPKTLPVDNQLKMVMMLAKVGLRKWHVLSTIQAKKPLGDIKECIVANFVRRKDPEKMRGKKCSTINLGLMNQLNIPALTVNC